MDMVERFPEGLNPPAEAEVRYELRATVDGEEVYCGEFVDEEDVQSSGLRKARHAVEIALQLLDSVDGL